MTILPLALLEGALLHLFIFVLAAFIGFEVITKVPATLHTPLMSGANAISGIVLVGAILVASQTETTFGTILGVVAVFFATINVVGGFVVTDRMLRMFRRSDKPGKGGGA